jgi:hypothetical protein
MLVEAQSINLLYCRLPGLITVVGFVLKLISFASFSAPASSGISLSSSSQKLNMDVEKWKYIDKHTGRLYKLYTLRD